MTDMADTLESVGTMNGTVGNATSLLTICIPTYNRRKDLEECLASVLPQAESLGVGVAVSDNCSSDDTWHLLETLKQQYPWMQIVRHTRDIGYRDNLTGVVLSSHAHYVWPIGDKLVLLPGALEFVVAELVRLHPDAVIVNSLNEVASTAEKIYSSPQSCLAELGWHTTHLGATILPRQAFVDALHVQPLSGDFPQVVALFSYLASVSVPQVLFSPLVLIQWGKSVTERHVASYYADRTLAVWGRNWYDAVMSLPALYSTNGKQQAIKSLSEHTTGIVRLWHLMWLRAKGELTLRRLNADWVPLQAAIASPWWLVAVISVIPRWMLRPILYVHPRRLLRAMRRELRLP